MDTANYPIIQLAVIEDIKRKAAEDGRATYEGESQYPAKPIDFRGSFVPGLHVHVIIFRTSVGAVRFSVDPEGTVRRGQ
jgi:hypothetical protein